MTRKEHIRTIVSLNPIMIDGTGMCGGCRVLVDGKSEFACVDGPEFDAHRVDFSVLVQRNSMYRDAEQKSMEAFKRETVAGQIGACALRKEAADDTNPRSRFAESFAAERAHEGSAPAHARAASMLRATNFTEVNLGYSEELARQEACAAWSAPSRPAPTIVRWA